MTVAPARLPLPGGEEGATLALHPLMCVDVAMPEAWIHRQSGVRGAVRAWGLGVPADERLRAPVVAFLVEHPVAGAVLVDTGFRSDVVTAKARALGPVNALVFRDACMRPEDTIAGQLPTRGVRPEDVRLIVMTHLHVDHASALSSGSSFSRSTPGLSGRASARRA